jgi:hypothetical protein
MKATELHVAIMNRDHSSYTEANELVKEMRDRVNKGEDPENVLFDEGFEPDYVFDLL